MLLVLISKKNEVTYLVVETTIDTKIIELNIKGFGVFVLPFYR